MAKTFRALVATLLAVCASGSYADDGAWVCDRSPLVITNARIWGEAKSPANAEIVIANGRIAEIGSSGRVRRPRDGRIVDAHGAWLLPGLIDSHVHFGRAAVVSPDLLPKPYPGAWGTTGRQTLASGVTTAKIHYADFEKSARWARESEDDCNPAPRIILGASGLLGGPPKEGAWLPQVSSPDDARQKVRQNAAVGAQWMELAETGKFSAAEIAAILDESRKSGLHLMANADLFEDMAAGLKVGVDAFDQFDGSPATQFPAALLEGMRAAGKYVIAPIGFFTRYNAYRADPRLIDRDAWVARRFEQPAVADALIAATRERFTHPPASEQDLVDNFEARRAKFRQLLDSGVKVVVGSDSGSQGHFQGDAIWWELRAWRQNGAAPEEIVTAATSRPAEMLRLDDRGAIRVGARGDFLLYDRDLENSDFDVRGVRLVAKGGVLYVRDGRWIGPLNPGEG